MERTQTAMYPKSALNDPRRSACPRKVKGLSLFTRKMNGTRLHLFYKYLYAEVSATSMQSTNPTHLIYEISWRQARYKQPTERTPFWTSLTIDATHFSPYLRMRLILQRPEKRILLKFA